MSAKLQISKRERGVIPPNGGDRLWAKLGGETYCIIVSRDEYALGDLRWHISVSNQRHLQEGSHDVPVWRDFVAIVHQLRPGVAFCIGIPPANQWMNKNPNVLHAYEVRDQNLTENWRINAEAVQGTVAAEPS